MTNLFLFLVLDFVTIVFTVIFFLCWANFNFLKMFAYLQKEYGLMMSISQVRMFIMTMTMMMIVSTSTCQAYLMIHNFCVIIIACAMDLTFAFNWVFEEGVAK